MFNKKSSILAGFAILFSFFFFACGGGSSSSSDGPVESKRAGVNTVFVHLNSDLDKINPVISTSANASLVERFIFPSLLEYNPATLEPTPVLAIDRPIIEEIEFEAYGEKVNGLSLTFEIREEATWDDGSPVLASDYVFAIKVVKNPKVDCPHLRPYFEFIYDIKIDETNPRKFTVYSKNKYIGAELNSAGSCLQESFYDPNHLMKNFSIIELSDPSKQTELAGNLDIIKFAEEFNSEKYSRDPEFVSNCGPYKLKEWTTGQRIILEKKENWWGEAFVGKLPRFDNYPDRLVYEVIVDNTTAVTAMKDESIDVMRSIISKDYVALKENESFNKLFNLHEPIAPVYTYIGLNMKSEKLADKAVRQALAHAVDYNTILDILYYNLAQRTIGPVHPNKPYYNDQIEPYAYDLNKAQELLDGSGWIDADGNGIREKNINGKVIELKLEFLLPSGSETGENIALMLKQTMTKLGIEIEIIQKEWTVYLEETKNHNFEMTSAAWVMPPSLSDFKQIWHTDSYNGGSNYVGFGDAYTDDLIDKIRNEFDEEKRNAMYLEFQEILHEEVPYIFLVTPMNKMAFHKRFDNANPYLLRPGHFENEFQLNPNFGAAAAQ